MRRQIVGFIISQRINGPWEEVISSLSECKGGKEPFGRSRGRGPVRGERLGLGNCDRSHPNACSPIPEERVPKGIGGRHKKLWLAILSCSGVVKKEWNSRTSRPRQGRGGSLNLVGGEGKKQQPAGRENNDDPAREKLVSAGDAEEGGESGWGKGGGGKLETFPSNPTAKGKEKGRGT